MKYLTFDKPAPKQPNKAKFKEKHMHQNQPDQPVEYFYRYKEISAFKHTKQSKIIAYYRKRIRIFH